MWILFLVVSMYLPDRSLPIYERYVAERVVIAHFATETECTREEERIRERIAEAYLDADVPYPSPVDLGYQESRSTPWETRSAFCEPARPGV